MYFNWIITIKEREGVEENWNEVGNWRLACQLWKFHSKVYNFSGFFHLESSYPLRPMVSRHNLIRRPRTLITWECSKLVREIDPEPHTIFYFSSFGFHLGLSVQRILTRLKFNSFNFLSQSGTVLLVLIWSKWYSNSPQREFEYHLSFVRSIELEWNRLVIRNSNGTFDLHVYLIPF